MEPRNDDVQRKEREYLEALARMEEAEAAVIVAKKQLEKSQSKVTSAQGKLLTASYNAAKEYVTTTTKMSNGITVIRSWPAEPDADDVESMMQALMCVLRPGIGGR